MYAIQVHSLEFEPGVTPLRNRNIFLDLSSEGQISRAALKRGFESIVYHTSAAVTLNLNNGPYRYHFLGVHTLYDFAQKGTARQFVTFGSRGTSPLFHLCYSVSPVTASFTFSLNAVTCLRQLSFQNPFTSGDNLFAEVEYNNSPHQIERGGSNRYRLGRFNSHQSAPIHSSHNVTFSTVSNFVVTFYVRNLLSDDVLCSFKYFPLDELRQNIRNELDTKRTLKSKSTALLNQTPIVTPSALTSVVSDALVKDESVRSGSQRVVSSSFSLEEIERVAQRNGLVVRRYDPEGISEFISLVGEQKSDTRHFTLSGGDWGSYEVVFTIAKSVPLPSGDALLLPPSHTLLSPTLKSLPLGKEASFKGLSSAYQHLSKVEFSKKLLSGEVCASSDVFNFSTELNRVELLVDGRETYRRMFEVMMNAQHSIRVLAWELSFQVALVSWDDLTAASRSPFTPAPSTLDDATLSPDPQPPPPPPPHPSMSSSTQRWLTLEDVVLTKAREGVRVSLVIWRHEWLSTLDKFLVNLRELSFERELEAVRNKALRLGLRMAVFHRDSEANIPPDRAFGEEGSAAEFDIIVVIAGNPQGLTSAHHEKLLLVDAECTSHAYAFVGGFDIAKGRYDSQRHRPGNATETNPNPKDEAAQQMVLWHDTHTLLQGPVVRLLLLHFLQRWKHATFANPQKTRAVELKLRPEGACTKRHVKSQLLGSHKNVTISLERTWKGVYLILPQIQALTLRFDVNYLFDDYKKLVQSAKHFIYVEHQYPFQNFALTYHLIEALKANKNLKVLIVTAIKTDLPSGLVGEIFDWSQDHIMDHLHMIYNAAPDRVGIYGLVTQDQNKTLRPIYVHSKVTIVDDELLVTGSTNMDNVSFFYSSELSVAIHNAHVAKEMRVRLFKEHLGSYYKGDSFDAAFVAFQKSSSEALEILHNDKERILPARPVPLTPHDVYLFVLKKIDYPTAMKRLMRKLRLDPRKLRELVSYPSEVARDFVVRNWIVSKL